VRGGGGGEEQEALSVPEGTEQTEDIGVGGWGPLCTTTLLTTTTTTTTCSTIMCPQASSRITIPILNPKT
jgi:hypothetical protein